MYMYIYMWCICTHTCVHAPHTHTHTQYGSGLTHNNQMTGEDGAEVTEERGWWKVETGEYIHRHAHTCTCTCIHVCTWKYIHVHTWKFRGGCLHVQTYWESCALWQFWQIITTTVFQYLENLTTPIIVIEFGLKLKELQPNQRAKFITRIANVLLLCKP